MSVLSGCNHSSRVTFTQLFPTDPCCLARARHRSRQLRATTRTLQQRRSAAGKLSREQVCFASSGQMHKITSREQVCFASSGQMHKITKSQLRRQQRLSAVPARCQRLTKEERQAKRATARHIMKEVRERQRVQRHTCSPWRRAARVARRMAPRRRVVARSLVAPPRPSRRRKRAVYSHRSPLGVK